MFLFSRLNPNKLLHLDSAYLLFIDDKPVGVRVKVKSVYCDVSLASLTNVGFPTRLVLSDCTPIKLPHVALYPVKGSAEEYRSKREQGLGRKALDCSNDQGVCNMISLFLQSFLYQVNANTVDNYPITDNGKQMFLKLILPNHGKVVVGDNERRVRFGVTFYDPEQNSLCIFVRLLPSHNLYLFNFSSLHRFLSASDDVRAYHLSLVR